MSTVERFRVRKDNQTWADEGPDLLRVRKNARKQLVAVMADRHSDWYTRKVKDDGTKTEWVGPISKFEALALFDGSSLAGIDLVFGYAKPENHPKPVVIVKRERVVIKKLDNCSPATSLAHSLVEHQFPHLSMSGAYSYRQVSGSSSWSDHAWGTAFDETEHPPDTPNDKTLDWVARMGRSGCMNYDYALGSQNGHVVMVSAPDFDVVPSGAASTHLWHVHTSVVDHHGIRPPRTGGVW